MSGKRGSLEGTDSLCCQGSDAPIRLLKLATALQRLPERCLHIGKVKPTGVKCVAYLVEAAARLFSVKLVFFNANDSAA